MKALALLLLLVGCSDFNEKANLQAKEVGEFEQSVVQGCDWRPIESGFEPRSDGCWHVYTGAARVSSFELADVCDAPKLPTCVTLRSGEASFGYYDRSEDLYRPIVRYEAAETLPDGSCAPCDL